MTDVERLLNTNRPFLTDGGFETWLFFQQGFVAPEFAAIVLMDNEQARQAMRRYFDEFLNMAAAAQTGFRSGYEHVERLSSMGTRFEQIHRGDATPKLRRC